MAPDRRVKSRRRNNLKKKKLSGLDKYLIFSFTVLLVYTAVSLVLFAHTMTEPATLTAAFYATFGGEVFACAMIKALKLKKESKGDEADAG